MPSRAPTGATKRRARCKPHAHDGYEDGDGYEGGDKYEGGDEYEGGDKYEEADRVTLGKQAHLHVDFDVQECPAQAA